MSSNNKNHPKSCIAFKDAKEAMKWQLLTGRPQV